MQGGPAGPPFLLRAAGRRPGLGAAVVKGRASTGITVEARSIRRDEGEARLCEYWSLTVLRHLRPVHAWPSPTSSRRSAAISPAWSPSKGRSSDRHVGRQLPRTVPRLVKDLSREWRSWDRSPERDTHVHRRQHALTRTPQQTLNTRRVALQPDDMTSTWDRHCERGEAIRSVTRMAMGCFATLAMTAWVNPLSSCSGSHAFPTSDRAGVPARASWGLSVH